MCITADPQVLQKLKHLLIWKLWHNSCSTTLLLFHVGGVEPAVRKFFRPGEQFHKHCRHAYDVSDLLLAAVDHNEVYSYYGGFPFDVEKLFC